MERAPPPSSLADELTSALAWWNHAGVDLDYREDARDWLKEGLATAIPSLVAAHEPIPIKTAKERPLGVIGERPRKRIGGDSSDWPKDLATFRQWWLEEASLDHGSPHPRVPPRGEVGAKLMIVMAQPEAEDENTLLSGPQGRLLSDMVKAMEITPTEIYLASALPRYTPLPDWTALKEDGLGALLCHHIVLAAPKRLLLLGRPILSLMPHKPAHGTVALREFNHDPANVASAAGAGLDTLLFPTWRTRPVLATLAGMDRLKEMLFMANKAWVLGLVGAAMLSVPAIATAQTTNSAAQYFRDRATQSNLPQQLNSTDRIYYTNLFDAIDGESWSRVDELLSQRSEGPLHDVARGEYYLHANSPRVELPAIQQWLAVAPAASPYAERIGALGLKRGLMSAPYTPQERDFVRQPFATKRILPRTTADGTMPDSIRGSILDHIKNDDPDGARQLLDGIDANLSAEARAEWRQRVAWSYYIENDDAAALGMARRVAEGTGEWVAEGDWVAGLSSWRMGDCESAAAYMERAGAGAYNPETAAAARYWASRAHVRCRSPEKAAEQLRAAAQLDETLYGMLAREQLGQSLPGSASTPDLNQADWAALQNVENARNAVALHEIGRDDLADDVLRHQARIGDPSQYSALSRLARELGLPSTQLWMAHNAPRGGVADPALRFPAPKWSPVNGWQVDPALAFAHALQESNFRASVVSPAGARGLMQIMPAAAQDHQGALGVNGNARNLNRPEVNLAFGQQHLRMLRDSGATQGKLPKIMAAYNAGLRPVGRWNGEVRDQNDPLLYMESIPYWETRGYVAIVMRNYWMYERQAAAPSPSRQALAEGQWPGFPGTVGGTRLSRND